MEQPQITVTEKSPEKYRGDLLVVLAGRGKKEELVADARICSFLEARKNYQDFCAKDEEMALVYPEESALGKTYQAKRLLIVGLGDLAEKKDELDFREQLRVVGGNIAAKIKEYKAEDVLIGSCPKLSLGAAEVAGLLAEGILLGGYRFDKYKKKDEEETWHGMKKLSFAAETGAATMRKAVQRAASLAAAVMQARDMANEPGNRWNAVQFAEHAEKLAEQLPLSCTILEKEDMVKLGMGGILGVNKGSAEPPKLVILDYAPAKAKKTIVLVGKGLTFDSGGISIKPAQGMQDMKYDMCGGAAVLGAMQAIAHEKPAVRVIGLVPSTDNMSGGSALKPGDIIRHYGGLTSEIINTDAEGRLILADAISYAVKNFKPDLLIDIATLTGAVIIGLGHHRTGLLSNDDALAEKLLAAGKRSGEPLWRLPLGKEYTKQLKSEVADMKNTGGRPAGTITAAAYLEHFVDETPWVHLDVAGTAWNCTEKSYIPKGPSGIMVRTLFELICQGV